MEHRPDLNRRAFLIRTGLTLGAGLLSGAVPALAQAVSTKPPAKFAGWPAVRKQFLLSREFIHMTGFLLASHPAPVRAAIERHRRGLDENPAHYWADNEERFEAEVLRAAADYMGVNPVDIALTDSTTMGLGLLYGGLILREGQEILTTTHDHYSTQVSWQHRAERTGASVRTIPLYQELKTVSKQEIVETLIRNVRPQTRYVAVTWVHSSTGLKLPIREMAEALAQVNAARDETDRAILCVDGVHGFGAENVTMADLGCDFFIAGCHKWILGPRGTGVVWGKPGVWPLAQATIPTFNLEAYRIWMQEIPPHEVPRSALMTPGGFHSFEHRWALNEAFRFHLAIGKARIAERIHALNRQLKEGLVRMKHVRVHTPMAEDLSAGIVCFEIDGLTPAQTVKRLRERRVVASETPYATKYVRLAPSLLTSPEDVEKTLQTVGTLAT
ncbi:MAG: aminotransferase class V-fold PLP-dependent enzyme [Nitrospirota bacterium]|nr:aminotransferase class V-fold PLP-dependent enzyme [Nitrospirota bacterium]MDE3117878.1 aminotransferase class V-fold PLP-dependent enzyme [Nitrospirota bacterium]MDE3226772.1 aminotransferase class V-fold PLP-dependent enzyme [Nitrospirota bacterium]MDE3242661.1 aminotransferase class V-fold PLP-dependent enzyme [Nitrospirota bacterium]